MPLPACCPSCGFRGDVEAFLVEPDAKRMIARVASLDADLGRVLPSYLRLFANGKRGLRMTRALKLTDDLVALVNAGSVCRDERVGVRRPATRAMWVAGMEQMIAAPPSGELANHHYLRAIVFGLADQASAEAERRIEADRAAGRHRPKDTPNSGGADPLADARAFARQMKGLGSFTQEQHDEYIEKAKSRLGGGQ